MQTTTRSILSAGVLGNVVKAHANSKGKIPSAGGTEEGRTRDTASRRTASPTHYRQSYSVFQPACLPACLPFCACVCPSNLCTCVCAHVCLSVPLPACLSVCLSACLPDCLPGYLSLSTYLPIHLDQYLSACLPVCPSTVITEVLIH